MASGEVTYKFVDEPGYRFVDEPKGSPSNAGLANFIASTLGLPVDTIENAINLTRVAQGTVAGAIGATDWMPKKPLEGSVGGSQWIKDKLRATGVPGLNPDNPASSKSGDVQYKMMSRGGFIPGGMLSAAGSIVAEDTLGPEWAGVGAMVPQAGITGYNAMREPSLRRQEARNAVRDQTLRAAQEEGYVVPPSAVKPTFIGNRLESIAGKEALGQQATVRNQEVTNRIAAREAGLPENTAISLEALERRQNVLSAPYREVAAIDPEAARALQTLRETRADATNYFRHYDRSADPRSLQEARRLRAEANRLEQYLEDVATNAGRPNLVNEIREARRDLAKTYDIERALNVADGNVSAPVLGRAVDAGRPLTGGLETAGRFQQAFPRYAREGERMPAAGVSKLEAGLGTLLGVGGYATMGPGGAALAALPLASAPVRAGLLSRPVQGLLSPSYEPTMRPELPAQLLLRLGLLNQPQ